MTNEEIEEQLKTSRSGRWHDFDRSASRYYLPALLELQAARKKIAELREASECACGHGRDEHDEIGQCATCPCSCYTFPGSLFAYTDGN